MRAAVTLVAARGVRGFGDGFTALLLPVYLASLGFSAFRIGVLTTATLLGSAALTLAVGLVGHRVSAKRLLFVACGLMGLTGVAFSQAHAFWPLVLVGFVGTLNPSGGDVSPFLPLEQSLLAHAGPPSRRTHLFARYSLTGTLMGALGALAVGLLGPLRAVTGLAQLTLQGEGVALTQAGITMGTPLYMSPEQVAGKPVDHRSDLYSYGVMANHMLSGRPPFTGETALSIAVQHMNETPAPLAELRPDLPASLCDLVRRLMAKKKDDRPVDAQAVLNELKKITRQVLGVNGGMV